MRQSCVMTIGLSSAAWGLVPVIWTVPATAQQPGTSDGQLATGQRPRSNSTVWNEQERAAVRVAEEWVAAWNTGDPQKVAAFMAQNCEFRGDISEPLQRGRQAFIELVSKFINSFRGIKLTEIYAVGGPWDTFVLLKRIDTVQFSKSDKLTDVPVATLLRVRDGKIEEWLDSPIVDVTPLAPGLSNNHCANSPCE